MEWHRVALPVVFAAAGLLVGWLYLVLLWRFVGRLSAGKRSAPELAALTALRFLLLAAGLVLAFLAGLWSIIAYLAGFLAARCVALRAVKRREPEKGTRDA